MKQAISALLFLFLSAGLSAQTGENQKSSQKESINVVQPTPQKSPSMTQNNDILSKDYFVAEKALKKAIAEKDNITIKTGLKSPIFSIKQKTAEAIIQLDDNTFVPGLIDALQENQGVTAGGNEAEELQDQLNKALISALEKLTKMTFNIPETLSPADINKVIQKSREWCKNQSK